MENKFDAKAIVYDIFWAILPIIGMLALVGTLALGVRLSTGKW
jgi:hypothetical protein